MGHWNLLILCNFGKPIYKDCGPSMIILDSLHMSDPMSKEANIRRFVRELYMASGRMETTRAQRSIPLLLPKVPQQRGGEECGVFMLYYMFLFAKNATKTFSRTSYPYFRKYDVGEVERRWIMKDLSIKWKYHKYSLQKSFFKQSKKTVQMNPPEHLHISTDMWKEAVNIWTSDYWRRKSEVNRKNKSVQKIFHYAGTQTFADIREAELRKSGESMDRSSLFIVTHTKKDGTPVNSECASAIEKIQALKQSQSSCSSSQTVASKNDIYCQVLGEDKPGRVRGVGTGPTPATLRGRPTYILKKENKMLGVRVKDLEERIAKLEGKDSKIQEENDSVDDGVAPISSSPKESANATKKVGESLIGKIVQLLDMDGQQVGVGIVMSVDPMKMVMERLIRDVFCEVTVIYVNKSAASLFIKDHHRKIMKDALGSHILWFKEYVKVDVPKSQSFDG